MGISGATIGCFIPLIGQHGGYDYQQVLFFFSLAAPLALNSMSMFVVFLIELVFVFGLIRSTLLMMVVNAWSVRVCFCRILI